MAKVVVGVETDFYIPFWKIVKSLEYLWDLKETDISGIKKIEWIHKDYLFFSKLMVTIWGDAVAINDLTDTIMKEI